jgi:HAD superfamily hydrolase (TIGR01459 family)
VIAFTEHFSALAPHYDVVLSDVWGVTHNGVAPFPQSCEALTRYRAAGGTVVLITNAPRPRQAVLRQLANIGVPSIICDDIVTSGDVTRKAIIARPGQSLFHLGPARNNPILEGLEVRFAPPEEADYVVCSGLFDDTRETPEDYREVLGVMRARNLFMVCGNPDAVVENGDQLIYCAGAIADLYQTLGGEVLYAGKPYPPIYDEALALAGKARTTPVMRSRVLAIGDSLRTDVTGAAEFGIDCLFVTAGIHAEEFGARDNPNPLAVTRLLDGSKLAPKAVTRQLRW